MAVYSDRLKTYIKELGLTNKEFAEKVGMSPQTVSNIINGRGSLTITTLFKIKEIDPCFNVNYLLFGESDNEYNNTINNNNNSIASVRFQVEKAIKILEEIP